jgi:hypothetical protein
MLPVVTYTSAELQEHISRWDNVSLHHTSYGKGSKQHSIRWLYESRSQIILLFSDVWRGDDKQCFARIMMPKGIWLHARVTGIEMNDYPMFERNMGLKRDTLMKLSYQHKSLLSRHSTPLRPGNITSQWTRHVKHSRDFDYRAYYKALREVVPESVMHELMARISVDRGQAYHQANRFDWEKAYWHVMSEIESAFRYETANKYYVDNRRVAKVGNRQHFHHYMKQKSKGCCGSYDTVVTLSDGQYHLGFNYGH